MAGSRGGGRPGAAVEALFIPSSRRRRGRIDARLEPALAAGDDPLLAPLRVVWLARVHDGRREVRLSDLAKLGDPRDPNLLRAALRAAALAGARAHHRRRARARLGAARALERGARPRTRVRRSGSRSS